jgi:hypothetical protein
MPGDGLHAAATSGTLQGRDGRVGQRILPVLTRFSGRWTARQSFRNDRPGPVAAFRMASLA